LLQASSAWAAGKEFAGFMPVRPLNILGLYAEEEQADLHRRLWTICQGDFPPGLHARSIKGVVGPLLRIENGSPARTKWFEWLQQTIKNHHPLDLVLLDPKSRLYGLDENNNDQNTQWVACLETLTTQIDVAFLFSHHVSKGTKEISQWMARGGGALVDGCRANFGMISLTEDEGKIYGLDDWCNYIKLKISKINIGPRNGSESFLKFDANGVLHPVDVYRKRAANMKTHFLELLSRELKGLTRRELTKAVAGKDLCDRMKAKFPDFTRAHDVDLILDALLKEKLIYEDHEKTSTRGKIVFRVR
jgi:replicative DNA helicase